MKKYHKELYFNQSDICKLESFNNALNQKNISYSLHAKQRIKEKIIDLQELFYFMQGLILDTSNIIEFSIENDIIQKVLYRIDYNHTKDIVISFNSEKMIITLYINNKNDSHLTLNKENYCTK